jgi:hypothetical protein
MRVDSIGVVVGVGLQVFDRGADEHGIVPKASETLVAITAQPAPNRSRLMAMIEMRFVENERSLANSADVRGTGPDRVDIDAVSSAVTRALTLTLEALPVFREIAFPVFGRPHTVVAHRLAPRLESSPMAVPLGTASMIEVASDCL